MAVSFKPTEEQRVNQWKRIKRLFNLTDDHKVSLNWSGESMGTKKTLVTIELISVIDIEEFNALLNGLPEEENANG